jgi:hypothetical protein
MSSTNGTQQRVKDDEGDVDRQTKQQILTLRKQVDDDERALYIEHMSDPESNLSVPEANQYWAISVRQYLRGIKRLWTDADQTPIRNVTQYWEQLPIGKERLVPPDKDGYEFSLLDHHTEYSDSALRRQLGLPRNADLPRPVVKQFEGLRSILKTNRIQHTWLVKVDDTGPPPEHEHVRLEVVRPVPKHILENAVEAADSFLQQAGLGFEVAIPDYYGGDEPGL